MPDEALSPLAALRSAVASYEPYLASSGEMFDPVFGEPTQYGTPYHALCQAVLALMGGPDHEAHLDRAIRGLDAALRHVADPKLSPNLSGVRRETGAVSATNHRDFFWPPVLKTYRILKALGVPAAGDFAGRVAAIDIEGAFRSRPPSNWAAVWLSGEWIRIREGLSPISRERYDRWLGAFFANHILLEQGLYQEPGHPNSYDLFTRFHLADMLLEGYDGAWRAPLERLMVTGLARSLSVQLSDGSLASAHRSTGQTWTVGAQCAYFMHAALYFREKDVARSLQATEAAHRAFASFIRWQRPDGPFSPVENLLPPAYRVGYEGYTCDAHYGNLAMGFLAMAVLNGFEAPSTGAPGRQPMTYIEGDPTYRALVHHGPYSAHVNAFPAPHYDGFGLVDLTFGLGRSLHFASSVRHLSESRLYNLGLALRPAAGRSELRVIAQEFPALIGVIEKGPDDASLSLRARVKGDPYVYELTVSADAAGVAIEESTPGRTGFRTLLIPYVRDSGSGETTAVTAETAGNSAALRFRLGSEVIRFQVDGAVESLLDLPYGYENRRGLCGLLRVDLAGEREGIRYRVVIEA